MEKHNQFVGATRRVDSAAHLETGGRQDGHWREDRVRIQLMTEHLAKPGVIVRNVYFCGGGVFRVHRGRFRFVLDGRDPIVIRGREILIVYPNQRVTIEALDKVNLFVYFSSKDWMLPPILTVSVSSMESMGSRGRKSSCFAR